MITKESLQNSLLAWQEALSLRDWEVDLVFTPTAARGKCEVTSLSRHRAAISIPDPITYPWGGSGEGLTDEELEIEQEGVMVHELMHLQYALLRKAIPPNSIQEAVLEQAITGTALTLVSLARAARRKPVQQLT